MSKLPISALANQYPRGVAAAAVQGSTMNQLFNSMAQNQSTSGPHGSSHSTVVDNSISFCVQGVFMWLLLVWITAGTAAIVVLMVKNCRTRWTFIFQKKNQNFAPHFHGIRKTQVEANRRLEFWLGRIGADSAGRIIVLQIVFFSSRIRRHFASANSASTASASAAEIRRGAPLCSPPNRWTLPKTKMI